MHWEYRLLGFPLSAAQRGNTQGSRCSWGLSFEEVMWSVMKHLGRGIWRHHAGPEVTLSTEPEGYWLVRLCRSTRGKCTHTCYILSCTFLCSLCEGFSWLLINIKGFYKGKTRWWPFLVSLEFVYNWRYLSLWSGELLGELGEIPYREDKTPRVGKGTYRPIVIYRSFTWGERMVWLVVVSPWCIAAQVARKHIGTERTLLETLFLNSVIYNNCAYIRSFHHYYVIFTIVS